MDRGFRESPPLDRRVYELYCDNLEKTNEFFAGKIYRSMFSRISQIDNGSLFPLDGHVWN